MIKQLINKHLRVLPQRTALPFPNPDGKVRIAVFSGSFNPVHTGHAALASYMAQCVGGIDEVWMLVSPQNPLKPSLGLLPDDVRLAMVRLVCDAVPGLRASDFEFSLPRPSFTYRTLCSLRESFPQHQFQLVIGSDNWHIFGSWRNPDEIIRQFGLIIYPRPGFFIDPTQLPENVEYLPDAPVIEISSTWIRQQLALGLDMNYFLPQSVYDYIVTNRLYGAAGPAARR